MTRSVRVMVISMVMTGGFVYLVLWLFEVATRHEVVSEEGLDLAMTVGVADCFGFLGVLAALLVAVHVSLWTEARRADLDEHGMRRVTHLDTFAFACGIGAAGAGVATVATAAGDGVLTGGAVGAAFAAVLVVVLCADASLAVQRDVLQRAGRRDARERRDALRVIVDRVGTEGPSVTVALGRLAAGVASAAGAGILVAVILRRPDPGLRVVDGGAPALAALLVVVAVGVLGALWWDRADWMNLVIAGSMLSVLLVGFVVAWAPAVEVSDLVASLLVGFVAPLAGAIVSTVRRAGALRSLAAVRLRRVLQRAEEAVEDEGSP